ncbi:MAG TPA: SPFH domain-containing protein [Steroidobacteraceae bacterium]|nr:SPFH domain-containing protein [Steroidobacteraceae bacterium]
MNAPGATEEVDFKSFSGYLALLLAVAALAAIPVHIVMAVNKGGPPNALVLIGLVLTFILLLKGVYILQPNQSTLLMLFGSYRGTDYSTGLRWASPFYNKTKVSLRLRNFNSEKLKVNDKRGNPIEIAAAIVWKVSDTARAVLDIDHYEQYVPIQAESALRHLANEYSYDHVEEADGELTLRAGGEEIIRKLKAELQDRFEKAGLHVEDARLTHLAYAPEIAGAMLRRQQAEAVIGARKQIVMGAVSMVEMALKGLTERGVVELDTERRAAMVSNLLVVLCAESEAQPVINAGSLYQ